jgi:carbon dioxide concentrating mechanism protein CcmN
MESEVTIGAGVLIAGQGTIGQRACIGAKATLWNCAVAPGEAIAPHSLMAEELPPAPLEATQEIPQATPQENPSAPSTDSERPPSEPSLGTSQNSSPSEPSGEETKGQLDTRPSSGAIKQVYGQAYFERMMLSLFPHRRSNDSSQNGTGNGEEG